MRVVGGKKDERGTLGAFVTMVTSDGPASTQGIQIGNVNLVIFSNNRFDH